MKILKIFFVFVLIINLTNLSQTEASPTPKARRKLSKLNTYTLPDNQDSSSSSDSSIASEDDTCCRGMIDGMYYQFQVWGLQLADFMLSCIPIQEREIRTEEVDKLSELEQQQEKKEQ